MGNVLVTGATGFLGRAAAAAARARGFEVVTTARRDGADVRCDLEDAGAVWHVLDDVRPTAVVNCAVRPDFGAGVLASMFAVNVLVPGLLAAWCASSGAHLVHVSATLVHGVSTTTIGPDSPVAPDTDYGRAKRLAEELVTSAGCDAAIVRLCGIYGAGGPAHLGLNRAIDGAIAGAPPTIAGSGSARRNYIHVDDAAAVLVDAIERRLTGTFLAAGPEVMSIAEMLETVCAVYLPGQSPARVDGGETADQIVFHDGRLAPGRPMVEALRG